MINLSTARETNFVNSTRKELHAYAAELGLDNLAPNADAKTARFAVMNALGMAPQDLAPTAHAMPVVSAGGSDAIFPSYNLGVQGIWGGRRHRLSIPRPDGVKAGNAEGYAWNGKHTYYIAYDEVTDVPEPIYHIIATNKRRRPYTERTTNQDGAVEMTTAWAFDAASMNYLGVDAETKNRAGSLMEWYQSRGTKWFDPLTMRQMGLIAGRCDIPTVRVVGPNSPVHVLNEDELRGRLKEFFFGYADADAEPNPDIEA